MEGKAAAIALGQASALTIMVCDLTIGKEKWKDGWGIAEKALLSAVKIMSRAGELADEDSDAFDEVMASFRDAQKDNDKEKLSRRNAIRNATLNTTEKPFETAKISFKLMEFLPELAQKSIVRFQTLGWPVYLLVQHAKGTLQCRHPIYPGYLKIWPQN